MKAVEKQQRKEMAERKALRDELDAALEGLEEKKKKGLVEVEKERQAYQACDRIQAERHSMKLQEYQERKDKTHQAKDENLLAIAQKQNSVPAEVEEANLVKKITTTAGRFDSVQKL